MSPGSARAPATSRRPPRSAALDSGFNYVASSTTATAFGRYRKLRYRGSAVTTGFLPATPAANQTTQLSHRSLILIWKQLFDEVPKYRHRTDCQKHRHKVDQYYFVDKGGRRVYLGQHHRLPLRNKSGSLATFTTMKQLGVTSAVQGGGKRRTRLGRRYAGRGSYQFIYYDLTEMGWWPG